MCVKGKMPQFDQPRIVEKPYVEEENFTSRSKVNLVDLFAGIGGFHYGVAAAAALGDAEAPVAGEAAENAGGKALHPYLKRILLHLPLLFP